MSKKNLFLGITMFVLFAIISVYLGVKVYQGNSFAIFISILWFLSIPISLFMYILSGFKKPTFWGFIWVMGILGLVISSYKIFIIEYENIESTNFMYYFISFVASLLLLSLGEIIRQLNGIRELMKIKVKGETELPKLEG